jgi:glycosyltransferase involved in cell wall biosynthesis
MYTKEAMTNNQKKIIAVASGDPFDPKTFSGYSTHLFQAIQKKGCFVSSISSRQLRLWDVFSGCVDLSRSKAFKRLRLSTQWLWREETVNKMSKRVYKAANVFSEDVPILQIGTHILPPKGELRPIYCVTDMTIKQAVQAGHFAVCRLNNLEVKAAVELQKKMFDAYRKIFVLCAWTKGSIVNDYQQPEEKVIIIGSGANMPPLEPDSEKYGSKAVLFVGIDWLRKGGPLLLEAFKLVREQVSDATFHIVGCSPNIHQAGVHVHGLLNRKDPCQLDKLYALYRRANCFSILPDFDPFPNVLLEAQITKTPVVSLSTGSREDAVKNGITGLLVKKTSAEQVADALIQILENPDYAKIMGQAGYDFISKTYTWDIIAEKILDQVEKDAIVDHNG